MESGRGCNWGGGCGRWADPSDFIFFFARDSSKMEHKLERDGTRNRERERESVRHSWTAERRRQSDLFGGATQHVSD